MDLNVSTLCTVKNIKKKEREKEKRGNCVSPGCTNQDITHRAASGNSIVSGVSSTPRLLSPTLVCSRFIYLHFYRNKNWIITNSFQVFLSFFSLERIKRPIYLKKKKQKNKLALFSRPNINYAGKYLDNLLQVCAGRASSLNFVCEKRLRTQHLFQVTSHTNILPRSCLKLLLHNK